RATASTFVSQFIESFVVLYIAFVIGPQHWSTNLWLAVGTVNYSYKVLAAIALIPLIYLLRIGIDTWLGKDLADQLKREAAQACLRLPDQISDGVCARRGSRLNSCA